MPPLDKPIGLLSEALEKPTHVLVEFYAVAFYAGSDQLEMSEWQSY